MSKPFAPPTYTQFSNDAIDWVMRDVSGSAWKIISVAIRKTYGWHKESDTISLTQFQELTGIVGRGTVVSAIQECLDKNILIRKGSGQSYEYQLNDEYVTELVRKSYQYENRTSTEIVPVTSPKIVPVHSVTSTEIVHTKERVIKEKRKKESTAAAIQQFNTQAPQRQAERVLLTATQMVALPGNYIEHLDTVWQLLDRFGTDKVEASLTKAFKAWKATPKKNGPGHYSPLNPAWIDWAIADLSGEHVATPNDPRMTPRIENLLANGSTWDQLEAAGILAEEGYTR